MTIRIWSAAILAAALAVAGCGQKETDLLAAAKAQLAKNDRAAATIQIKNALQKNPNSAEGRYLLGKVLLESGSAAPAEVELQRALELGYPAPQVTPLLARSLLAQGKPARVTATFADVEWPDAAASAELKVALAQAWMAQGSLDDAAAAVAAALRLHPQLESAILVDARLKARQGDPGAALKEVEDLLAREPKSAEGWTLKGDLLLVGSKDHGPAIEAYRQAVALQPGNVAAHAALISLHLVDHDLDAAARQLAQLKAAAPKSLQATMLDGQVALAKGDLQHAREQFQLVLRVMPNHLPALQSAGMVELGLDSLEQAESLLNRALQLAPNAIAPRVLLAQTYLRQNQPAKAQAMLSPLVDQPGVPVQVLLLAAQSYLVAGDAARAEALFQRAAKAAPGDPKIRTALALSHLTKGNPDSAVAELQAISAADTGVSADLAMISTLTRQGKIDAALKATDTLAKKQPDKPLADLLRGQLLMRKKDLPGARQSFERAVAKDPGYYPATAALAALDMLDRQPEQAKSRLTEFLKKSPGHVQAMLALAEVAARSGATRDQVTALIQATVKARPNEIAPRLALIDYQMANGNAKDALASTQAALVAIPDRADLVERLGRAQLAVGDREQAESAYNRLVKMRPKSPVGYLGLADVAQAKGDYAEAARQVRQARELAPDSPLVQRAAIEVAIRNRQPEQALAIAHQIQSQQPGNAAGYLYEGEIAMQQKQWPAAEAAFRKALGKPGGMTAPVRLHAALVAAGKTADADHFSAGWRKDHPKDTVFLFYLGDAALARGDQAAAERWYRAVVEQQPDHAIALNNIAWLMVVQKEPGALAVAEQAVKAAPEQPQVLDTLAQAQAAEGQTAKAVETSKKAVALAPRDPALRLNLAKHLLAAGDKRQAKAELDRLAALGSEFAQHDEVDQLQRQLVRN
jgi:putative PEP-CTERM system TPR-repeat lipoprotein